MFCISQSLGCGVGSTARPRQRQGVFLRGYKVAAPAPCITSTIKQSNSSFLSGMQTISHRTLLGRHLCTSRWPELCHMSTLAEREAGTEVMSPKTRRVSATDQNSALVSEEEEARMESSRRVCALLTSQRCVGVTEEQAGQSSSPTPHAGSICLQLRS